MLFCVSEVHYFDSAIVFHCMDIPQFLYPFIYWCSSLRLSWLKRLWIIVYKNFFEHIFSFLLGEYLEEKPLDHKPSLSFNFIRACQTAFQSGCTILQFHQQWESSNALSSHQHFLLFNFSLSGGCQVTSHVVLIWHWPFTYLPSWSTCLNLLPIFYWIDCLTIDL